MLDGLSKWLPGGSKKDEMDTVRQERDAATDAVVAGIEKVINPPQPEISPTGAEISDAGKEVGIVAEPGEALDAERADKLDQAA